MTIDLEHQQKVLSIVHRCARRVDIPLLVVGATARDLLLEKYGNTTSHPHATLDVDVACRVPTWDEYETLVNHLLDKDSFSPDPKVKHRIIYDGRIKLDILPFGGVTDAAGNVVWRHNEDVSFNALGLEAAYKASIQFTVCGEPVQIASFPAIVWLKLAAWQDNKERTNDLEDIWCIVDNYFDFAQEEGRLISESGEDADIFEDSAFTTIRAGARLLGRDMARQGGRLVGDLLTKVLFGSGRPPDELLAAMRKITSQNIGENQIVDLFENLWKGAWDILEPHSKISDGEE